MMIGMKTLAMTAVRVLMDRDFLKNIKEDFTENIKGLNP
jgi:hypothetical protein